MKTKQDKAYEMALQKIMELPDCTCNELDKAWRKLCHYMESGTHLVPIQKYEMGSMACAGYRWLSDKPLPCIPLCSSYRRKGNYSYVVFRIDNRKVVKVRSLRTFDNMVYMMKEKQQYRIHRKVFDILMKDNFIGVYGEGLLRAIERNDLMQVYKTPTTILEREALIITLKYFYNDKYVKHLKDFL